MLTTQCEIEYVLRIVKKKMKELYEFPSYINYL